MLGQKIAPESFSNGNFIGLRERRFFTNIDHFTFTDGDIFLLSHSLSFFAVGLSVACHGWRVGHRDPCRDGDRTTETYNDTFERATQRNFFLVEQTSPRIQM